jgi:glycosyltransferase involved in cell wall biosynthesis
MRVLKIYDGDYPWDVRVEKVTATLIQAGYTVRLLCRNRSGGPRRERLSGGLEVRRLPRLPSVLSFPFFLNPVWILCLLLEVLRFRPHRLLVRDLPLSPLVVSIGRLTGIPVIADLAEPYPDSLRSQWRFQPMSAPSRLVRNPALADYVERFVVRSVPRALAVCVEAGKRLERQGLPSGRWTEVGNTVMLDMFVPRGEAVPELEGLGDRCLLLFSGLLAGDRGVEVALDALVRLRARHPGRFALVIVGDGPVRAQLEAQVVALGLDQDVRFTGWLEHSRLPDVIVRARLGLLPFHACEHINATLANKLFEYMALGLPVVASNVPPMIRVLEETRAGVTFRSGDSADLADKIERLAQDHEERERCAAAGRNASNEVYNWRIDGIRLVRAIENPEGA